MMLNRQFFSNIDTFVDLTFLAFLLQNESFVAVSLQIPTFLNDSSDL
jgi:hypothetical protein